MIAYLYFVKKYYETGWGKALLVAIVTAVLWVVVLALIIIGLGGPRLGV